MSDWSPTILRNRTWRRTLQVTDADGAPVAALASATATFVVRGQRGTVATGTATCASGSIVLALGAFETAKLAGSTAELHLVATYAAPDAEPLVVEATGVVVDA